MPGLNLIGDRYGILKVVKSLGKSSKGYEWLCECDCGNETTSTTAYLRSGHKTSCGCLKWPGKPIHGLSGTVIQQTHANMKRRCDNPKNNSYKDYGARGITYDKKWKTLEGFAEDMLDSYEEGLTLDRIDSNGNYCKENCRWIDRVSQANNTRANHIVEYKGEMITLADLARKYNVDYELIRGRIGQLNWDVERALTEDTQELITYNGVTKKVGEYAVEYGMTYHQLKKRLMRGWTIERAITQPLRKRADLK